MSNSKVIPVESELVCRPVVTAEVVPALRLVLGSDGQLADESQALELMKVTGQRGINLADIWVCVSIGRVLWAALPVVNPGRTVLYFGTSAQLILPGSQAIDVGIEAICRHYEMRGIQLAQVLLEPEDEVTIAAYTRHRFERMAELHYLQRTVKRTSRPVVLGGEFRMENYSPITHTDFAVGILASYEKSLDCPPLNGMRNIEDVVAGHKAAGVFDPEDWFVVLYRNQPVAVLLLSMTHQLDGMELVYLGLSPTARGKGLGNYLMQLALARVSERKVDKLTLAVDSTNAPALNLYYRFGMSRVAQKVALMRVLGNAEVRMQNAE